MEVKLLIYIFLLSVLFLAWIVFRKHYSLKKLREFVRREKIEKEKKMLEDLDVRSELKTDEDSLKRPKVTPELKKSVAKADMLIARWEYEEARKLLISLLVEDDYNFDVNLRLWKIALKSTNYKQAEIFFTKCLAVNRKDSWVFSDIWFCFFKNAKFEEAIEAYEYSISIDSQNASNYVILWQIYFVVSEYQKAIDSFLKSLKLNPRNTEVMFMLAENYIEVKLLNKALEVYYDILEIEPYNQEAIDYIKRLEIKLQANLEEKNKA